MFIPVISVGLTGILYCLVVKLLSKPILVNQFYSGFFAKKLQRLQFIAKKRKVNHNKKCY
jgi:hypothetical protein